MATAFYQARQRLINLIRFPKPEQQVLQELIDLAVDEVFADYDESGRIRTRAIAVLDDKTRKSINFESEGGFAQLATAQDRGLSAIHAAGAKGGAIVVHLLEQGREMVFIFVLSGDAAAVCALGLIRQTGDPICDLALVTEMTNFDGEIEYDLLKPSDWWGPVCTVDIQMTAEILKFQPKQ